MSNPSNLSSPHAAPNWQGSTFSLPRPRRLYYYGAAIFLALIAATLIGASILLLFQAFVGLPPTYPPLLSDVHPIARIILSVVSAFIGVLLLKYAGEVFLATSRTMLHIAPEGFIFSCNGGAMWSTWDNAARLERFFLQSGWQEGIMLREPANVTGRTAGFFIFSTWGMPWNRFIPLTLFGTLWRIPLANQDAMQDFARLARKLLPAHTLPSVAMTEGALYHEIRRCAEHLFISQ